MWEVAGVRRYLGGFKWLRWLPDLTKVHHVHYFVLFATLPCVHLFVAHRSEAVMAQLMKVREVARTLGVHENTVRRWEERGLLRAVRLPSGVRRFRPEDVEAVRAEMFSGFAPLREDDDVVPVKRVRSLD
jgi:excisionase family DNA binding protein